MTHPAYELLPATQRDEPRIRELHGTCYRDVVERQFGGWDADLQRSFFDAKWDPNRYTRVVIDGVTVGAIVLEERDDDLFLAEILVAPEFQRQGLGTSILTELQRRAAERGLPIRLQVFRVNRAVGLYRRLGFTVVGETATHLQLEFAGFPR